MKQRSPVYFCNNCKKIFNDLKDLYVVEESVRRTFCSDECVVQFFTHLIDYLNDEERDLRTSLGVSEEDCLKYAEDRDCIDETLGSPDEVWAEVNSVGEELYYFIKKLIKGGDTFHMVIMCYLYQGAPSFVFFQTTTKSQELLKEYRSGVLLENFKLSGNAVLDRGVNNLPDDVVQDVPLSMDELHQLELKKSIYLAKLIDNRSESDIPMEDYLLYDKYFIDTVESPDELYEHHDEDGDTILTYIKAQQEGEVLFYYIAICLKYDNPQQEDASMMGTVLPVVSFPTLDPELYKKCQLGVKIAGGTIN